ncbi:radical SAM family heme chaperone HemW [Aquifex aeolicus]|uniref:Heme chaperone HemW n=1 Tax=Aquifex aeolicus (strain VF5) TaxID=224324 RepID=O67418_AQUAE|nr:radical SAM family heme chaperone HemW [Aquifex aeolicus]AAC07371.1 oxygen-independent coproporphyrinogen III oxidase [Aquifex aeolicus VF5]
MIKALYVHVPFCSYKCPYCDFLSLVNSPVSVRDYLSALKREINLYRELDVKLETLYFGGGTPTLLKPEELGEIIEEIDKVFGLSGVKEITVECNPETYRKKEFEELKKLGVNRISVGVQSFTEKGLRVLGRKHTVKDSLECLESLFEAGIENVNVDLIWGWPTQSLKDLEVELEHLKKFPVKHVSAYLLTLYEDTPMGLAFKRGEFKPLEEEEVVELHKMLSEGLRELGFKRYEISNWAKEGFECRHNLVYWKMEEFLGVGVSAWGFYENVRYGNTKNISKYVKFLKEDKKPVEFRVQLDETELEKERIMLGLRTTEGIEEKYLKFVPEYLRDFFEVKGGRLRIKEEHLLISNELITEVLRKYESSLNKV